MIFAVQFAGTCARETEVRPTRSFRGSLTTTPSMFTVSHEKHSNALFFLHFRASVLNFNSRTRESEVKPTHTQSSCSTPRTSQSSSRLPSSPTCTSSLKSSTANSRATSSLVSLENGRNLTCRDTQLQLVASLTTFHPPVSGLTSSAIHSTACSTAHS